MQTLAQAERAAQSFEDARLQRYLDQQDEAERELRMCGNCGRATPIDGSDVLCVLKELPKSCSLSTRRAVDRALRSCVWCGENKCLMEAGDEACQGWAHYADCED
ncbi:MAG: hypothetical protein IKG22_16375 [Atopobiaceae bacterium]|nr:hypothetical protein [Atopobiaceae bacterium]